MDTSFEQPTQPPEPAPTRPRLPRRVRVRRQWRSAKLLFQRALAISATLSTVALFGAFLWAVSTAVFSRKFNLQPISVPGRLADAGYTTPIVTTLLRDQLIAIQQRAYTDVEESAVSAGSDSVPISLPLSGISADTIVGAIRQILPERFRHDISGEFVLCDDTLMLRLRYNQRLIFEETATGPDAMKSLLVRGAIRVIEEEQPFIAASYLQRDRQPDAALDMVNRVIVSRPPDDPNVPRALSLKADILSSKGQRAYAMTIHQDVIQRYPSLPYAWLGAGKILYDENKLDEAFKMFQAALALSPNYPVIHNNLGRYYSRKNMIPEAIAAYRKAIELNPLFAVAHANLGLIYYYRTNQPELGLEKYRTALRIDPKAGRTYFHLGRYYFEHERYDNALENFRAAIRYEVDFPEAHLWLGDTLLRLNDPAGALEAYRRMAELAPKSTVAACNIANALALLNRTDEANQVLDHAQADEKTAPCPHIVRGEMALRAGHADEALTEFTAAQRLAPNNTYANHDLGNLLLTRAAAATGAEAETLTAKACAALAIAARQDAAVAKRTGRAEPKPNAACKNL